jgi:hypothetical protein
MKLGLCSGHFAEFSGRFSPNIGPFAALAALSLLHLSSNVGHAQNYSVSGEMVRVDAAFNGPYRTNVSKFSVVVSGCEYRIDIYPKSLQREINYSIGFDGETCYSVESFPDNPPESPQFLKDRPANFDISNLVSCNALLSSGPIPPPHPNHDGALLYMAFASSCLLKKQPETLRPIWQMEYPGLWSTGIRLKAVASLSAAPPNLPESVTFFNDGKARFISPSEGPKEIPAPKPFDKGFTNAVLKNVLLLRNGLLLPTSSTFTFFVADLPSGATSNSVKIATEVTITSLVYSFDDSIPVRPNLKQRSLIADLRVESPNPLFRPQYLTTNGQWNIKPMAELVEYHNQRQAQISAKLNRYPLVILVACLFASMLIILKLKRRSHNTN